ncbi:hypothetical protein Tco_0458211 [Tanacetum coccineum]
MSVKYPNYVNLTSLSEEQPNERNPSPPPRKKSLSPLQAPSKSISSKSTHYTSSSSLSDSPTPTHVAPPPKLHFVIPIKQETQELPPLQILLNDPYAQTMDNWPPGPSNPSLPLRVTRPHPSFLNPPPGFEQLPLTQPFLDSNAYQLSQASNSPEKNMLKSVNIKLVNGGDKRSDDGNGAVIVAVERAAEERQPRWVACGTTAVVAAEGILATASEVMERRRWCASIGELKNCPKEWHGQFARDLDDHRMLFMCLSDLGGQVNARGVPKASKVYSPYRTRLASFFARLFKMTNFAAKHSIMTPEMVENFCNDYYIPDEVHPVAPGRDNTITQFPEGKVGVYTRFFDYCGYRIPFTKFLMAVLRYFRIHISQLSPFGAARVSHFEVLTRVLDLAPSILGVLQKPPDSIKNWPDHFFWVDAKVFPIPVSLYVGGTLEKDPAPHLTARQEQTVRLLENNKAPFRRYPECFLCLVGLSPYYPFDENTYPAFERPDGTDMGLLDFIKTADPRKVQAVEVQKKDDQVKLLESTSHCFMPLVTPAAGGSSSAAAPEVSAPEVSAPAEVEPENVVPKDTYLDLTGPDEVVATQPGKSKRKRLGKQSDTLPAKQLRKDHPSFATGTGGKTLAGLRQLMPTSPLVSRPSFQADTQAHVVQSARITDVPVYTAAATVTSARENVGITPTSDVAGSSQLETSEGSDDSFYELPALNSAEAKRCMDYEQLYTEFNVGAARQICLESEVRSRAEHELELKEKLKGKYDARGRLLEEKDLEILRLKSLLVEEAEKAERAETAEVVRLRGQVSALTGEVSVLKSTIAQKDTDISLLDSRATYLKSALDDSKAACAEAGSLITSLTSERDRLTSEVSTLHTAFQDFKEKAEAQQEEQAQVLYNRVAELEAHVMDVSGRLEGEFYPAYLTTLAGRRWFLTHGIQLAVLKCFKSPEYQGILGHALGRAVDFGMQEGLEAGYEHGVAGTPLFAVEAYNPEAARTSYFDAVRALEDVDFPLVNLLKSKNDVGMDEVLDCFILDGPLADLPEAAHLQPCLKQLSVPNHHSDDKAIVGETSLSFALLNVHSRAEGAKKHAASLWQLMMEIVSNPLSSQTWVGETSTFAAPLSVEDFDEVDTNEALGSVVAILKFEACHF